MENIGILFARYHYADLLIFFTHQNIPVKGDMEIFFYPFVYSVIRGRLLHGRHGKYRNGNRVCRIARQMP